MSVLFCATAGLSYTPKAVSKATLLRGNNRLFLKNLYQFQLNRYSKYRTMESKPPQNKSDKLILLVTIVSVLVAIAAWQFPVSQSSNAPSLPIIESYLRATTQTQPVTVEAPVRRSPIEINTSNSRQANSPLVKELSFSSFMLHLEQLPLDSNKISYIKSNKDLLTAKIHPNELNNLLHEFGLDSARLQAVSLLRDKLHPFSSEQIEAYLLNFDLASNKQRAMDLLR